MVEKTKSQSKGFITEEDISTILKKYEATTALTLLQEVGQVPDVKIDWNALVKKTKTGITNAREYQMLWRHLAYRDSLVERLDDGAEPLDDDSDLEFELEAFPTVSFEVSAEAAACVKVLNASGIPSDSTVEAPLTINIPNGQSTKAPSEMQGKNISVSVFVQKQPQHMVTSAERLDANGSASANLPGRRRRKAWSAAEDMELISAVEKFGEGNWANILKGDFKGDRNATQLSQRWSVIRKRRRTTNVGGSQLSEDQVEATRRAMSFALDMPMGDKKAPSSTAAVNSTMRLNTVRNPAADTSSASIKSQHESQQDLAQHLGTFGSSSKSQQESVATAAQQSGIFESSSETPVTTKNPSTKSVLTRDESIKAAAVAAGARIATPSDAATLLKAAQAKNTVHIMPGRGVASNANSFPGNVHFMRTGLTAKSLSTYSSVQPNVLRPVGQQVQGHAVKPIAPTVQINLGQISPESDAASRAANAAASNSANDVDTKTSKVIVVARSVNEQNDVQNDKVGFECSAAGEAVQGPREFLAKQENVQEDGNSTKGLVEEN